MEILATRCDAHGDELKKMMLGMKTKILFAMMTMKKMIIMVLQMTLMAKHKGHLEVIDQVIRK